MSLMTRGSATARSSSPTFRSLMLTSPGRPDPVTRHRRLGTETHAGSTAGQLPAVHPAAGSSRGRRPEAPGPSREGGASGEASGRGSRHSPGLQPSFTEDGSLQPQGTRRNREGDQEWGGRDQSSISEGKGKGCGNGAEAGGKPGPDHREGSRPESRSPAQPYSMQDAGQT